MANLSAEAKVGLLVIVGSAILLYMTIAVGKYEFGEKKGYTLEATFDSVAGIDQKAAVRMAGVKIGTVEKVELDDSRAKVTLRLDEGVKIKRGSEAMIKTLGLLGEKYVEFMPARLERPVTAQARRIPLLPERRPGPGHRFPERRGQAHQPALRHFGRRQTDHGVAPPGPGDRDRARSPWRTS